MPVKQRNSKTRNPLITSEAIALFRRGLELQKLGADHIDYRINKPTPEEREYLDIQRRLNWGILGLVGVAGPLDVYPGMDLEINPQCWWESVPHALELRRQLMKGKRR